MGLIKGKENLFFNQKGLTLLMKNLDMGRVELDLKAVGQYFQQRRNHVQRIWREDGNACKMVLDWIDVEEETVKEAHAQGAEAVPQFELDSWSEQFGTMTYARFRGFHHPWLPESVDVDFEVFLPSSLFTQKDD